MAVWQRPLADITEPDLQSLIDDKVMEGKEVDYKEAVLGDREAMKEFLADLSSFANTIGGHLLIGVKTADGVPTELVGIVGMSADSLIGRLESAARDAIEPRLPGVTMRAIRLKSDREIIGIHIPRSYALPHVVRYQGHWRFYARNSNGKYPLDVAETGTLFARSRGLGERLRDLRAERLAAILGGQAAAKLDEGPKLALHVVPLGALDGRVDVGIPPFVRHEYLPKPIGGNASWGSFNFDGWLTWAPGGTEGRASSYALLYRSGIIEAVSSEALRSHANPAWIPSTAYELETIQALASYLELQRRLGTEPPVVVLLSLVGVARMTLAVGPRLTIRALSHGRDHSIDRDALLVPELLVENFDTAADQILRPAFDAIWNACGWDRSYNYTAAGTWIGQQY